jgi:hypothetical protein
MPQGKGITAAVDERRLLVERVAASRYFNRSVRLRDLLLYLSERVLEEDAAEIHEQEVGHRVFGRPADYDTTSDNIVRVHVSTLRKRLEQYFASEGADEPMVLEIPKGNYAPIFRERNEPGGTVLSGPVLPTAEARRDRRVMVLSIVAILFACSTAILFLKPLLLSGWTRSAATPAVRQFWSQVFRQDRPTDIVLDDAALSLYQELTGRTLALSEYFDRSYLRKLGEVANDSKLKLDVLSTLILRRQSSAANTAFLWKVMQLPEAANNHAVLRFARDYSFRDLRTDSALLLGHSHSNPWIEPFLSKVGLRWEYDRVAGVYYPVDSWSGNKSYSVGSPSETREGFCGITLLPNLGGTSNVLIVSGTGGSALNAGADFLSDEKAISRLRRLLPATRDNSFPPFEALLKVKGRSGHPEVVVCRTARHD